jgi:ribonuclease PH
MTSKSASSLRPLRFQRSFADHAEGCCLVSMGRTQVLCVATIEDTVPPHAEEKGTGWVTAEYAMLPRSGEQRTPRARAAGGGRVQEISRLVGRSLRAAVDLAALGPRTITLDCDVLRADGGTRTASVNGGLVALVQAMRGLEKSGSLPKFPLRELVGAVSVGLVGGRPIVDMSYAEDKDAEADLNLVMTESGHFVEIQGTAENGTIAPGDLRKMMDAGARAIRRIIAEQKSFLGHRR